MPSISERSLSLAVLSMWLITSTLAQSPANGLESCAQSFFAPGLHVYLNAGQNTFNVQFDYLASACAGLYPMAKLVPTDGTSPELPCMAGSDPNQNENFHSTGNSAGATILTCGSSAIPLTFDSGSYKLEVAAAGPAPSKQQSNFYTVGDVISVTKKTSARCFQTLKTALSTLVDPTSSDPVRLILTNDGNECDELAASNPTLHSKTTGQSYKCVVAANVLIDPYAPSTGGILQTGGNPILCQVAQSAFLPATDYYLDGITVTYPASGGDPGAGPFTAGPISILQYMKPSQSVKRKARAIAAGDAIPSDLICHGDDKACPVSGRPGMWECIDTKSNIDACGGCPGVGMRCDELEGIDSVSCVAGKCLVSSCVASAWKLAPNGTICLPL